MNFEKKKKPSPRRGYIYVVLAAVLWGVSGSFPKFLFNAVFFAAVVWNILQPPLESFMHIYSLTQWGCILYVALMGTLVPFGLYFEAIRLIRSTHASITATLEPIVAGGKSINQSQ